MDGSAVPVIPRLRAPVKAKNMKHLHLLAICLPLAGCLPPALPDELPFRGEWRTERTADFVHRDGETVLISGLVIGGAGDGDNFANRGDVIVTYDSPGAIEIRARPFAFSSTEAGAKRQYEHLQLWLYDENVRAPLPPAAMPYEASCATGAWREGCGIRVYYADRHEQPIRSGMDLHVRLPPDFTGKVEIETEDLLSESYDNRGDVCIAGLPGSADVQLEDGLVAVTMADTLQVSPSCPAADIAACESWSTPWAADCPCLAKGYTLGQLHIEGGAVDVTVDTPSDVPTTITALNRGPQPHNCVAEVTVPGAVSVDPARGIYTVARAPGGAPFDYGISAFSDECAPVGFSPRPGAAPREERRGDLTVCTGCIQTTACEDFLDDDAAPRWR